MKNISILKYICIISLIVLGVVLTILGSTLVYNIDVLMAVGSGIFGSSFVSLLLEISNDIRYKTEIENQRDFVFEDIKFEVLNIIKYEVFNFSSYCYLYSERKEIAKKEESIENILVLLKDYADKINNYIAEDSKPENNLKIDEKWLQLDKNKDKYLCVNCLSNYENLLKKLNKIMGNKDFYFNLKIITQEEFDQITTIISVLEDIIRFSQFKSRYYIIEEKQQFFEEIQKAFDLFDIDKEQTIRIQI